MPGDRASIFGEDEELDLSDFAPKQVAAGGPAAPPLQHIRKLSEARGFRSREGGRDPVKRRYRTGRNVQLNIKVTAETLAEFNDLCERHGWVQGEALARAVEALKAQLADSH
jgi:hypothetical protein